MGDIQPLKPSDSFCGSLEAFFVKGNIRMGIREQDGKIDQKVLDEILNFIRQINYGEVVITIHDSEIVQVEKREKKRFQR